MPGMVKVGKTNRDPKDRLRELSAATGIPTPFVLVYSSYFADCLEAEQFVHAMVESSGHRVTSNREFFHATVQEATDAVLKAKASLGGADAEPAPPRIAAMPRRVMRCSATTVWSFLSDTTATYDYADRGFGPMSNADVHASLVMLVASTAHVMWVAEMKVQLAGGHGTKNTSSRVV